MQQSQLCDFVRCLRNEDGTNPFSILFRNPAAFALRIVIPDKLRYDFRRQCLVRFVPSVLLRVENSLPMDDPAHVARLVLPQQIWSSWLRFVAKQTADRLNGVNESRSEEHTSELQSQFH